MITHPAEVANNSSENRQSDLLKKIKYKLFLALKKGNMQSISDILEKHSAMVNQCINNLGWTPVHVAAYYGHELILKTLVERGADTACRNSSGYTPHMLAKDRKNTNIL